MIRLIKRAIAALTPPVNTGRMVYDTADPPRPKFIDENGLAWPMSADGLRDQNLVIGGGFDLAQRQTAGTLTTYSQTAARQYTADRFGVTNENASIQYRRVDTSASPQTGITARNYGEYSKTTTTGKIVVSHIIEGNNCLHLRGHKCRVQMKLRASAAKTLRIALLQLTSAGTLDTVPGWASGAPSGTFVSAFGANTTDPTFGANLSKIAPDTADNATIANSGLTCAVTTTFQRFSGTFTLPTDFRNLVVVVFTDSQFVAADLFAVTEVGLYDGVEIRDWVQPLAPLVYTNYARYYCKSFQLDQAPAAGTGLNTGEQKTKKVVAGATAGRFETITWPTIMRTIPTVTFFNPVTGASAQARDETNSVDCTATTVAGVGERQTALTFTGNAATVAEGLIGVHWTSDAEL